jgi:hypothetical protein
MMKRITVYLSLTLCTCSIFSQTKYDNIWILGYDPNIPDLKVGGTLFDFSNPNPTLKYFQIPTGLEIQSSICDTEGNILFYTNGCSIVNKDHDIMVNGDSLNYGEIYQSYCDQSNYPTWQGILTLPFPSNDSIFYMFHVWRTGEGTHQDTRLLRTIINSNHENGLGSVTSKNELILEDVFVDQLTAVRHGNGRDWWIILPKYLSNTYYIFLFNPGGIQLSHIQSIGTAWNFTDWAGQVVFSPDGSKYVRMNSYNGVHIFDFDRCSGYFDNPKVLPFPPDGTDGGGAAISPNSRFLYISTLLKLYQYDLSKNNIQDSEIEIAEYDGFGSPLPLATTFFQMMLAPNDKIYMTANNTVHYLHTIHEPDNQGTACGFEQHDLELPVYNGWKMPNFPYFRLYDLDGSPCDTLGIDGPIVATEEVEEEELGIKVYPNPTGGELTLSFEKSFSGGVRVTDLLGKEVMPLTILKNEKEYQMTLPDVVSGVYWITFLGENQSLLFQKKAVVIK